MKAKPKFKLALLRSLNEKNLNQDGFTLIEVIVAIVILSIFIVTSLTALVTGLNFKLKAKLNNEATLLIQQDLEQVRYQATQFGLQVKVDGTPTVIPATPNTTSTTITTTNQNSIVTSSAKTIDLGLRIDISGTPTYLTSAGTRLSIGRETNAYRLTSTQTPTTRLDVTVDLGSVSSLNSTTLASASSGTTTSITVPTESVSKFRVDDRIVVGPASTATSIFNGIIPVNGISGNVISLGATVPSFASGTRVTILPRSTDLITNNDLCTNDTTNIATTFIAAVPNLPKTNTTTFNGRPYQLMRTSTPLSTTRVKIEYQVYESISTTSTLAELTTEVIPSVEFKCP